jgi:hypothetical protein
MQKVISQIQAEESRSIDKDNSAVELTQRYILLFWKRQLEHEQRVLAGRTDISNEDRFKETTQIRHDLHAIAQGWEHALPILEARLHSDAQA